MGSGISLSGIDSALGVMLDGLAARQRAIASNVANADTPGYKGIEVQFERQLALALERRAPLRLVTTNPLHLRDGQDVGLGVAPEVVPTDASTLRNDRNNVDLDREMTELADTQIRYSAGVQLATARLSLLRSIINEGRR